MAMWQIDEIGRLTSFGEFGYSGVDQIAAAVAPHSTSGFFLAGRQSPFYTDADHSTINNGDEALIKFVSSSGTEAWSLLIDSAGGGGGDDTNQVAVDVINDGNDDFLVLINRQYGEFGLQDFRVMMLSASGNIYWDKRYSISNTNVFAQKIVKRANGHYLILANDVDNGIPILYEISGTGVYETHEEYPQANPVTCIGITNNTYNQPNSGYRLAGSQDNGADQDGFIIEVDNGLTEQSTNIIENPTTGNESFRDIVAHPTGYLAVGECDNRGEGQRDVWICHLDTLGDTLKVETLGGEEIDYGQSVALIPSVYSAFIAGYNNSYTVEESGNAYLGGVKVDMGLPESGPCEVQRSMWVDRFTWNNGNSGIDLSNYILGNNTKEDDLVDFAEDHNITYLILFGLNFVFEPGYQADPTTQQAKVALSNFINKCYNASPRIVVGMASTTKEVVWTNGIQYNIDVTNNASQYNYNQNGKITYFVLEHEFWNAQYLNAFSGNTSFPTYDQEDGNTSNDVPTNLLNDHFVNVWNDHKTILTNLNNNASFDANVVGLHDYNTFLFYTYSGASSTHDNSSTGHQITRAQFIESKTDAIFLTYYRKHNTTDKGQNFLTNYPYALDRLSFFGSQTHKTHIIPLFSGEIWDVNNQNRQCGDNASTDFLGAELQGIPGNGNKTFKDIESTYQSQHLPVYNNTSSYPDIQNVSVSYYSWYKYSCLNQKSFTDNGLVSCDSFNGSLNLEKLNLSLSDGFKVYPNPTSNIVNLEWPQIFVPKTFVIYSVDGKKVKELAPKKFISVDLPAGIYYVSLIDSEKNRLVEKLVV